MKEIKENLKQKICPTTGFLPNHVSHLLVYAY